MMIFQASDFHFERLAHHRGQTLVVGIDEVGRGPLAGPVVAAAILFDPHHQPITGVTDSKKLSAQRRLSLVDHLKQQSLAWGIGVGSVELINTAGIATATTTAMDNALAQIAEYHHVLIDGLPPKSVLFPWQKSAEYIIKGDSLSYSIAAASIVAKVYRDQLMTKLAVSHPGYGWEKNMGYGTARHLAGIKTNGLTPHHRLLFCRKVLRAC